MVELLLLFEHAKGVGATGFLLSQAELLYLRECGCSFSSEGLCCCVRFATCASETMREFSTLLRSRQTETGRGTERGGRERQRDKGETLHVWREMTEYSNRFSLSLWDPGTNIRLSG